MNASKFTLALIGLVLLRLTAVAETASLKVDQAKSKVEISVHATGDSFVGSLANYQATIGIDPTSGDPTSAKFRFLFSDLKTGKDKRDAKMLSWEESQTFPEGSFELGSLKPTGPGAFEAKGVLKIHGHEQSLEFPIKVNKQGAVTEIDGDASLDTQTFGLPIIRLMGVLKVDPIVKIHFHLSGTRE